jgi:phage gpG-like protein
MAATPVTEWKLPLAEKMNRLAREWLVERVPAIMQVYVEEHFHAGHRTTPRNLTDKLYVNTGRLARSFAPFAREGVLRMKGLSVEYGTKVPYAAIHEYGGRAGRLGRARIPARPYIRPAVKQARKELVELYRAIMQEALR